MKSRETRNEGCLRAHARKGGGGEGGGGGGGGGEGK
jgi:hypothetical protein